MLKMLPDLKFPITPSQVNPLMDNLVQLNLIEGAIHEKYQRGLGILFHIYDLWVKSGGGIDYRSMDGHSRLVQDATIFVGPGNPVATRHGDLAAAHLAIDFSDTQIRLRNADLPLLPADISTLLSMCRDLAEYSPEQEKRIGLMLDMLGKKSL